MIESSLERDISRHYGVGGLFERIMQGLAALGIAPENVRPEDLGPIDEFHIGGPAATAELVAQIALEPGMEALDIGSGLGGTARHVALATGALVSGVDITEEYVALARRLSALVGLDDVTRFETGSALALPFADGRFDAAFLVHVGMNIPDKPALFAEARRVLRRGGVLGVYEVMRTGEGRLAFPVPWAESEATSFEATPDVYRAAARAAGFAITSERTRRDFALNFFARMIGRAEAAGGPPPLGVHLLMRDSARKFANMKANIEAGLIAPVEMILHATD